ncbi:MAG: hypothetical protein FJ008_06640 [Chloroflexi bacterium]|nr:hypothetical protein [Chloroflexota bacterium]MBM3172920.1 hypothetical protein [Chloroflexota bacterium]MBM3175250.1 hypothetical protein [Chloroflexota bacterium]MBM4451210.1 hypothetical protein [Chloroflexota bacterium]
MEVDERIQYAIERTEVLRTPQQSLATFGATNIYYYIVTELVESANVVREGRVIAARPKIVTPAYLTNLEGFSSQARRFIEMMAEKYPREIGVFYSYKNEPKEMNVVSEPFQQVVDKINQRIDLQHDPLSAIIKGVEELWDVSLLKFTYELTQNSMSSNVAEMERSGLLRLDNAGVPVDARKYIEELFAKARTDLSFASELAMELKRWGLFHEYQDRFFGLFRER